ncbi:MAG: hypothetical protein HY765_04925 [Rhodomicrobium sp.]|nr:hypothetical protein [Rhodomicrobium sp.]
MNALLIAASAFFLLHLLPATPFRGRLVAVTGEGLYIAAFSLLSLITLWWLAWQFEAVPYGEKFWSVPAWWLWLKAALMLLAFIFAVGGVLAGADRTSEGSREGIDLATAWKAISLATVRGFLFFGAFAATALIGSGLQQRRKARSIPDWGAYVAKTSFFPFAAIFEGRATFSLKAIGWWRIAIAVIVWAAILHFHYRLFGAQPLPLHS